MLTSSKSVMRVRKPRNPESEKHSSDIGPAVDTSTAVTDSLEPEVVEVDIVSRDISIIQSTSEKSEDGEIRTEVFPVSDEDEYIDFSNGWILTIVSYLIFIVILAANLYVFVVLGQGGGGN
ncbi:hypothetical protein EIP86_000147 [Pleurotus ostreatoroseus]|nr:hypothetical protein EIP86_000147 [Pleurotus ostreatoroseus]